MVEENENENKNEREVIIQGLDVMDVVTFIIKKSKRYQAMGLQEIEEILDKDSKEFKFVRKVFLDTVNNFARSVLRAIFGDVEHLV